MDWEPVNGCVLVELTGDLTMIDMPDKQYSTNITGIVRKIALQEPDAHVYLNRKVVFEAFKDAEVPVGDDDTKYTFVKIEDIRGYEQTQQTD